MKLNMGWVLGATTLLMGMTGCASQPARIRCDERLQPINAPAPKVTSAPAWKAASTSVSKAESR